MLYASADNSKIEEEIRNHLIEGRLTKADSLTDYLLSINPDTSSYFHRLAIIMKADIAGALGNVVSMESYLSKEYQDDDNLNLNYYWKVAFSKFCFLNRGFTISTKIKEEGIELSRQSQNARVQFSGLFDELFLIYYSEDIENKLHRGEKLPSRVSEIFSILKSRGSEMQQHEKFKTILFKMYYLYENDKEGTETAIKELSDFGNKFEAPNALIWEYLARAKYHKIIEKDSVLELEALLNAKDASKNTEDAKLLITVYYELASYYYKNKNYEEALEIGKKSIFPGKADYSVYLDSYGLLAKIYEEKGMLDSALHYKKIDYEKYKSVSFKYYEGMQTFFIKNLQENIVLKDARIENDFRNAIVLVSFLLIVLFLIVYVVIMNRILKNKNKQLQIGNELLENFSNILSHDLRAPIHSIRRVSSIVIEEENNLTEDSIESLRLIESTSSKLTLLITNIMTFIRSKEAPNVSDPVHLTSVIESAIENLDAFIQIEEVEIEYDKCTTEVLGNKELLTLLIQNLIQNSIKAKRENLLKVEISIRTSETETAISVKDNGIGIRPEKIEFLKTAFNQEAFESAEKGVGLGLSICSNIMLYHNGKLQIESLYEKGTTVFLKFPVGKKG